MPDAMHARIRSALDSYAEPEIDVHTFAAPSSREFAAWAISRAESLRPALIYARHFDAAILAASRGIPTVLETHAHVSDPNPLLALCCRATRCPSAPDRASLRVPLAIATISPVLAEYYVSLGAAPDRVHIVPDGVDLRIFSPRAWRPSEEARDDAPPPPGVTPDRRWNRPIALYSGHLYDYKGVPTVLAAAALDPSVNFHFLGGSSEDVIRVARSAAHLLNVCVHGSVPHREVPRWLLWADVLLLPPTAHHPSAAWTSPVKLGEYLASERPIVASRVPGLVRWVSEPAVRFFAPDDPRDMLLAIRDSLSESPRRRAERIRHAGSFAESFSYANRASRLIAAALC